MSLRPLDKSRPALGMKREKAVPNFDKKAARQQPQCNRFNAFSRKRAKIRARPCEGVSLGQDDPGLIVIKTEATFCGLRELNGGIRIIGGRMRDGQNDHTDVTLIIAHCYEHRAGPVFNALLLTAVMLARPEIRISNDKTGFRNRQAQVRSPSYFLCHPSYRSQSKTSSLSLQEIRD